jgi:beta-lactamase superfamily II metal-dependent hydrolase
MVIYTLNVGQGQFTVVTGQNEAFIVDTYVPLAPNQKVVNVLGALASILKGKEFVGLIISGFDSDHFNKVGMRIILNKYRPNWIMYPKYYKETKTARDCFNVIKAFETEKAITKYSIELSENNLRFYGKLSKEFTFEVFSPHAEDMDSSNNCSLVCKVKEIASGRTYLITGDTENDRWDSIVEIFGAAIKSDVLDAPHHGSHNGITQEAMDLIHPTCVVISAGIDNQYDHPDDEALEIFNSVAEKCYSTNYGEGQSLMTVATKDQVETFKYGA